MTAYNSSADFNQDDADMTMINHSFLFDQNDEPISACLPVLRRSQQTNQSSKTPPPLKPKTIITDINPIAKHDYVFVDQDPLEAARQIEHILRYYRQDLKQDSNTQVDCSRKMIIRLVDFIRPVYSSDQRKIKDFDALSEEISKLHDKRDDEQRVKNEQLQSQLRHLRKSIISTPIEDDNRESLMINLHRMNSMVNYEQWMEMEEEIRKLHDLVETQRDRINELVKLITEEKVSSDVQYHHTATVDPRPATTEESVNNTGKEYFIGADETGRTENHLPTLMTDNLYVSHRPKQLECPLCAKKLPDNDDIAYIQHLSECFNQVPDDRF